jgi:hypothetical protein
MMCNLRDNAKLEAEKVLKHIENMIETYKKLAIKHYMYSGKVEFAKDKHHAKDVDRADYLEEKKKEKALKEQRMAEKMGAKIEAQAGAGARVRDFHSMAKKGLNGAGAPVGIYDPNEYNRNVAEIMRKYPAHELILATATYDPDHDQLCLGDLPAGGSDKTRKVNTETRAIAEFWMIDIERFPNLEIVEGHEEKNGTLVKTEVCKYFAKGTCKNGNQCRFTHSASASHLDNC